MTKVTKRQEYKERCECGHLAERHRIVGKIPRNAKVLPKFKCVHCNCRKLSLQ